MSHKANPKLIGAFIAASGVLLVVMILFFGSSSLLSRSSSFILFFDQSVNGLNVGSPVKFRGVPVGSVERILIRTEGQRAQSNAIPVIIGIEHSRIEDDLGLDGQSLTPNSILSWLDRGLLARLSLESLITGQLFVELSVEPDKISDYQSHLVEHTGMVEIPTQTSQLDAITSDIGQLIADFGAIDLPRLNENMNVVLENLSSVLAGLDSDEISRTVIEAAQQVTAVVGSEDFKASLSEMRAAFASISKTAASYELEAGALGSTIDTVSAQFTNTLERIDLLVNQASGLLDVDSSLLYALQNTLRELSLASQSVRTLTDYLERNPNALLTGRAVDEN